MKCLLVDSSNLSAVGYESGLLRIQFHSGGIYDYSGVPESIYLGLMNAPSHGQYFWKFIRNVYPYRKVA